MAHRIMITIRFRVRQWREIRRKPKQQNLRSDSKGGVFLAIGDNLEFVVFKGFIFFLLFLLTKTI